MRSPFLRLLLPAALIAAPVEAAAQTFADFCPGADAETQAAVVGWVTDPGAGTIVPGATIAASWVADGERQRLEARSNLEGLYALCGLPLGTELSVRAIFGDTRGPLVPHTTDVTLAQQDLEISLTSSSEALSAEVGSLSRGGSGGKGRAYSADVIRQEDLLHLPEMSLYDLLRQHSRLRFERMSTRGEVILLSSVNTSLNSSSLLPVQVLINERREGDPISALRGMSIDEVRRIDILTSGEASARYGGDGWVGAIAITTRIR